MTNKKSFTIIGGDDRQLYLGECLLKNGYIVKIIGFENKNLNLENVIICNDIYDALNTDIVILGIPYSKVQNEIYAPYSDKKIYLDLFFDNVKENTVIFGGKLSNDFMREAKNTKSIAIDYAENELFTCLNSVPTAEGTIKQIMNVSNFTIDSSNCLITGFGRTAKILAKKLNALNANITIAARRESQLYEAISYGYDICKLANMPVIINNYDVIINTVPAMIFKENLLNLINDKVTIIDIASLPGGVDFKYAGENNINAYQALGIPGKEFPKTAGEIIFRTVINILEEVGL